MPRLGMGQDRLSFLEVCFSGPAGTAAFGSKRLSLSFAPTIDRPFVIHPRSLCSELQLSDEREAPCRILKCFWALDLCRVDAASCATDGRRLLGGPSRCLAS